MKKVYTELYYESDCNNYEIRVLKNSHSEDRFLLQFPDVEAELTMSELKNLSEFIKQFLIEQNPQEAPKPVKHDPRFAPDPTGLLGF